MKIAGYRWGAELVHTEHTAVYRATRESDGLPVIIKTLSREYPTPADLRRLQFEHRILSKLRGPGVIEALELVHDGPSCALVLEDFGGQSLASHPLPLAPREFLDVAGQAVQALGRIHGLQIIHKDLKPANLLRNAQSGQVKLIDFQVATEVSRERQEISVTNQLEGSLPYISPEQTGRMNRALDYRSDYYSLGITFFELLSGRLPFQASDVMGWLHCHISRPAPELRSVNPAVPAALSAVVHKLMSKEPRERYQSARGLLADLERCRALLAAGDVEASFVLGQADTPEIFGLSQRLVGRDAEAARLVSTFEVASHGPGKLLLVSGYSGVGKSSLIREVHKPLTSRRGYFVSGKFDQLERSLPYAALLQAMRSLLRQLLAESEARVQSWRERLHGALGEGAGVLCEVLPELAHLLGPQPAPAPLDPAGAQNRFQFVFGQFLQTLATPQHPLALFLDDLQWADAATLDLVTHLFSTCEIRHLLMIGAYRDNEVSDGHLLAGTLRHLRERAPAALAELRLAPLDEEASAELVATTLRCARSECAELTREIQRKTEGNPFFISELLTTLYRKGLLSFAASDGRWVCDLEAVRHFAAADNVVDLMLHRLGCLEPDAVAALKMGACVGSVFSLATVARLLEQSPDATARALWAPIQEGLVVPLDDNYRLMSSSGADAVHAAALDVSYRFQHDRVQQAAYTLIAEGDRAAVHLRIGRELLRGEAHREQPAELFTIANHLNLGRRSMAERAERLELARLNRDAGAKAFAATAFGVAASYYDAGALCLADLEGAEQSELSFLLLAERVRAVLMAGQHERAAELCEELFPLARSREARGRVFLQKCEVMVYQGKFSEAIGAVREGLKPFGIDLPADPAAIDGGIGAGIGQMQRHLARVPIDDLARLPDLEDPELQVAMQLLFQVVPPAIMTYPPLFILAELLMFDLALTHGICAVSAKNFVDCGMIQGAVLGDYASAYRLGQVAFRVLERYQARALESQVEFVFAAYISQWGAPHGEALEAFRRAQRLGIETGDHQHLAYAQVLYLRMLLHLGRPLDECEAEASAAETLLERIRAVSQRDAARLCRHALDRLRDGAGNGGRAAASTEQLTAEIVAGGNAQWSFQHGQLETLVEVLFGDWAAAERWSRFTTERLVAASTLITLPEYYLCECLVIARQRWPEASAAERAELERELAAILGKLRGWAELCPVNMDHKYQLAAAEVARLRREPLETVLSLYEKAAQTTGKAFLHLRALATELQGRYWLKRGHPKVAQALLREALRMYTHWGASAKVQRLEREMLEWFGRAPPEQAPAPDAPAPRIAAATVFDSTLRHGALDLTSVLKATQAISSEVKSERLFAILMNAILENAAAEHGCLILVEDGGALTVRARADIRHQGHDVIVRHALEQEPRVCAAMVRYVARSLDALVIDDAGAHPDFGRDEYVQRARVRSALCMPIKSQGRLVAVLYAENNVTTFAFTSQRVETLRLIAGQAAISITNASLYESLEQKVEERTRELRAKTRKIEAMLDGMQQGVFALDEELRVQPEYSRHLEQLVGGKDIVGRPLTELLFAGAELGPDVLSTNESALRFSFGAPRAVADANADHMIKEFSRVAADGGRRHFEVDWSWILGESSRVDRVLVTARDVTRLRGLEAAAAAAARETEVLNEILDAGLEEFRSFGAAAHQCLGDQMGALSRPEPPSREAQRALFRCVHTLKAHARVLGLRQIVAAAHAAEEACAPDAAPDAELPARARQALQALDALVREYESVGENKLGRLWVGADERFKQAIGAIESALAQGGERPSYPVRTLTRVRKAIDRINAVPLDQVLRETARVFPSLALELGKSVPRVEWEEDGILLDAQWGTLLKDALVHSFRNSIDHGIETPEERARAGKSPEGRIALRTRRSEGGMSLHLSDDGRGLPLDELRTRMGKLDDSDQAVAEAIFEFGISTADRVSQVSGRGVGMDVVRGFFREHGGDVAIEFTGAALGGHRPFELVFRLPTGATLDS